MKHRLLVVMVVLAVMAALSIMGCAQPSSPDSEAARRAGSALLESLRKAVEDRDADKLALLCHNSPEFALVSDGKQLGYDEFIKVEREMFPMFEKIAMRWDTLQVKVLSADAVVGYAKFRQVLTSLSGEVQAFRGDGVWFVVRKEGGWKMMGGHAWHIPE